MSSALLSSIHALSRTDCSRRFTPTLQFRQLGEFQFRDTAELFCLLPPCQNSWCTSCRSSDFWALKTTVMLKLKCWTYILNLSPGAVHMHSNLSLHAKTASLYSSVSLQWQKSHWDLMQTWVCIFFLPSTPISYKRPAQQAYSTEGPLCPPRNVGVLLLFSLQESPQQQTLTLNCAVRLLQVY